MRLHTRKVRSAFLSPEPVREPAEFVGREELLYWVADGLSRKTPVNCNLIGLPRIGKTSFLYKLYSDRAAVLPGWRGVMVMLRLVELPDFRPVSFWRFLFEGVRREASVRGPDLGKKETAVSVYNALDQLLTSLVEDGFGHIVLLIDDFDLLKTYLEDDDLNRLRALANRYASSLAFVITSLAPLPQLEAIMRQEPTVSSFSNLFESRQLGLLQPDEAEALCQKAAELEGREAFSVQDLNFLLTEAGRHPDLLKRAIRYWFDVVDRSGLEGKALYEEVCQNMRQDPQIAAMCKIVFEQQPSDIQEALLDILRGQKPKSDNLAERLKRLDLVEENSFGLTLFADVFGFNLRQLYLAEKDETAVSQKDLEHLPEQRVVRVRGQEQRLTRLESRLLGYFMAHPNRICSIGELLENVWGGNKSKAVVEKGVNRLRAKIEEDPHRPRFLLSARGEGYILRL